jgi:uncharacterized protein
MTQSKILVDSSFLYALYSRDDNHHETVIAVAELYHAQFIIPYVVLTEVAFLFRRAGGAPAVARFLAALVKSRHQYEITAPSDLLRAHDILIEYADVNLDFVDCCLMALAERLDVTQIATLDRRDFSIFRPRHCDYLELLP